jgi:hypothetical protein
LQQQIIPMDPALSELEFIILLTIVLGMGLVGLVF